MWNCPYYDGNLTDALARNFVERIMQLRVYPNSSSFEGDKEEQG